MTVRTMLALGTLLAACPAGAQQSCESLATVPLRGIAITSAASVPAGSFTLPGGPAATWIKKIKNYTKCFGGSALC